MWRLLALDDPQANRILLSDADSVISRREAVAVEQWVASGKRFHMMRDAGSHTELILAGRRGVVAGSLPPLESRHFADQHFLRQYVWPYARASLMQHDLVFGSWTQCRFPMGRSQKCACWRFGGFGIVYHKKRFAGWSGSRLGFVADEKTR